MGSEDLTVLLRRAADGDEAAFTSAVEAAYASLAPIAQRHLNRMYGARADDATLETSALVHETFLKLRDQRHGFENRAHFYAIASRVMLRALRDYERKRRADKRGGQLVRVTLSGMAIQGRPTLTTALDLEGALDDLDALDTRKAQVVRLRTLWGQTIPEIAEILAVSVPTVERDWRFARVWLHRRLTEA